MHRRVGGKILQKVAVRVRGKGFGQRMPWMFQGTAQDP